MLAAVMLLWSVTVSADRQTPSPAVPPPSAPLVIIKAQHRRLPFTVDIQRIAVGDAAILSAELITSREVLILGRDLGRTTLLIWFADGVFREYLYSVQRDLSVLERALAVVHPGVRVESAPDREALVLTGTVPNVLVSQAAETIARNYLNAGATAAGGATTLSVGSAPATDPNLPPPGSATTTPRQVTGAPIQLQGTSAAAGTVINLLRMETLPPLPEQKIREAVSELGGRNISIRRILKGDIRNDAVDTLVLEGEVPNQIALVRVLTVAAQLFAGQTLNEDDIRVVADEGGALAGQGQSQSQGQGGAGGDGGSSQFGGLRSVRLSNQVRTNLARAKAIQLASGRLLSFIEVKDLPQVRVHIRLAEVNRSKLRAFDPNAVLALSNFRQSSLNPASSATAIQGDQAARVGTVGAAVQNVLSFLNGGLLNEIQFAGSHAAIDLALGYLERQGIARSLSSPSLTVLSGESAQVQVGGEVPIPTAFSSAFAGTAAAAGSATPGVFSSVQFVPYGIQLQIRALVGDDDTITLDVQPQVVTPDTVLTDSIRQSTGAAVATTAFQTRALRTTSRLQDGQSLIIGGLVTNNLSDNEGSVPLLRRIPVFGRLFQSSNRNDQSTELVVVVNPVLVRTPIPNSALWAFPSRHDMLHTPTIAKPAPPKP